MDFTGPLPRTKSGQKFIIVRLDYHSRWPEAKAVQAETSKIASEFLVECCCRFGVPEEHRGTHFLNRMMESLNHCARPWGLNESRLLPSTHKLMGSYNGSTIH